MCVSGFVGGEAGVVGLCWASTQDTNHLSGQAAMCFANDDEVGATSLVCHNDVQ